MMMKVFIIFFLLSSVGFYSYGYVVNRSTGSTGAYLEWATNSISLYADPGGRTYLDIETHIDNAISQWNSNTSLTLSRQASSTQEENQNDIYFPTGNDRDEIGFGSATLAITITSYYIQSGEIIEGDIAFNTDFFDDASDESRFADVITHEMGHFIGLSHSEVKGSTMLYTHFSGQDSLADDDRAGGYAIYPYGATRGEISGKVIGGSSSTPIFGAHVQAVSEDLGIVVASAITEDDGTFSIDGLALEDTYYLYTGPIRVISSIPSYFDDIKKDFCSGGADYRGSFFQSCLSSEKGYPQGVKLEGGSASRGVGSITIRCNLDNPSDYSDAKNGGALGVSVQSGQNAGNTLVGAFTREQFSSGSEDGYSISLGNYEPQNNEYLEIKIISQGLYSVLDFETSLDVGCSGSTCESPQGSSLDKIIRTPLTSGSTGEVVDLTIRPRNYMSRMNDRGTGSDFSDDICLTSSSYPSCRTFGDNLHFYLLSFRVVTESSGEYTSVSQKSFSIRDNGSCPDAGGSYAVSGSGGGGRPGQAAAASKDDDLISGCGSLDVSGGGPKSGGPLSLLVGFFMVAIFHHLRKMVDERVT